MPAKKWTSKKKAVKNVEKIEEKTPPIDEKMEEIEENTVDTVVENEISDVENESGTILQTVEKILFKKSDLKGKKEKSKVIWTIGWTEVKQPEWRIRFEAQVQPFPLFMLPDELRKWLVSNGLTSDVYAKDKEWLEKHNVDMEMVEKLKKFLTERL